MTTSTYYGVLHEYTRPDKAAPPVPAIPSHFASKMARRQTPLDGFTQFPPIRSDPAREGAVNQALIRLQQRTQTQQQPAAIYEIESECSSASSASGSRRSSLTDSWNHRTSTSDDHCQRPESMTSENGGFDLIPKARGHAVSAFSVSQESIVVFEIQPTQPLRPRPSQESKETRRRSKSIGDLRGWKDAGKNFQSTYGLPAVPRLQRKITIEDESVLGSDYAPPPEEYHPARRVIRDSEFPRPALEIRRSKSSYELAREPSPWTPGQLPIAARFAKTQAGYASLRERQDKPLPRLPVAIHIPPPLPSIPARYMTLGNRLEPGTVDQPATPYSEWDNNDFGFSRHAPNVPAMYYDTMPARPKKKYDLPIPFPSFGGDSDPYGHPGDHASKGKGWLGKTVRTLKKSFSKKKSMANLRGAARAL